MATPGVLKWANDIRFAMSNDPARQKFKDELNYRCSQYLRDFDLQIEAILAGPDEDCAIDLLKTPGRSRVAAPRMKPTPSKLRNLVPISLEENDTKENVTPINDFHKALLLAKGPKHPERPTLQPLQESPKHAHKANSREGSVPLHSPLHSNMHISSQPFNTRNISLDSKIADAEMDTLGEPTHLDLSIIGEDEEMDAPSFECCQAAGSPVPIGKTNPPSPLSLEYKDLREELLHQSSPPPSSTTDSFHTVALDTSVRHIAVTPPAESVDEELLPQPTPPEEDHPMDDIPPSSSRQRKPSIPRNSPPAQVPPEMAEEIQNEEMDISHPITLPDLKEKTSTPNFPPPEPMPLRKSMRAPREPEHPPSTIAPPDPMPYRKSMRAPREPEHPPTTAPQPTAQPIKSAFGKRTSWLTRAKEIKALQGPLSSTSAALGHAPPLTRANPLKRKSDTLQQDNQDVVPSGSSEERPRKSLKVDEEENPAKADWGENDYHVPLSDGPTDVLDQLRSTVARMGKSMGKPLGAAATAHALAEARAAAEPRVAERDDRGSKTSLMTIEDIPVDTLDSNASNPEYAADKDIDRRLSLSDLVSSREEMLPPGPIFRPPSPSPDRDFAPLAEPIPPPSRPVFTRPEKIFFPPESQSQEPSQNKFTFQPPTFSRPAAISVGLSPRLRSPSEQKGRSPGTAQSTQESVVSDNLFDSSQGNPAWLPSTQDTEYSLMEEEEEKTRGPSLDDDDSWPLSGPQPVIPARTDDTWSTMQSNSQPGDTGPLTSDLRFEKKRQMEADAQDFTGTTGDSLTVPGAFHDEDYDGDEDDEPGSDDAIILKPTINLVQPRTMERSPSPPVMENRGQWSEYPSPERERYESQELDPWAMSTTTGGGFFNQASKFVSTVLGTSKKVSKHEVKSIQLAAAAAKRQQEEQDRKEARLREMEARRQAAVQRKAEEEKARTLEEARKVREENERRKKEREELTGKRALMASTFKKQGEEKKRVDVQKKPSSKTTLKVGPPLQKSVLKAPSKPFNASTSSLAQSTSSKPIGKPMPPPKSKTKHHLPSKPQAPATEDDVAQPSQMLQSQMAARAKAQIKASKPTPTLPPSELIDLPDIQSEYSDSDDSDRERKKKKLPAWTQSPELKKALEVQSTINPDDIFGTIKPLKMGEVFGTKSSRFRPRTSSANWTGADKLTVEEEKDYARRMGFK